MTQRDESDRRALYGYRARIIRDGVLVDRAHGRTVYSLDKIATDLAMQFERSDERPGRQLTIQVWET